MTDAYAGFEAHDLDEMHRFFVGRLPEGLRTGPAEFESLWAIHPEEYHVIQMHGRPVEAPRWQQAYGRSYRYTGRTNEALPVSPGLEPALAWGREAIDGRLNGLLLSWYDGSLGHYIGPHHDSTKDLVAGAPIVTVALGEAKIFRLSDPPSKGRRDFAASDGTAFVMPFDTNLAWKHAVPRSTRHKGRRISITLRAFEV